MVFCLFLTLFSWQQRVSYTIEVRLDAETRRLSGVEYGIYRNNSPFPVEIIYLHLYANAYQDANTAFGRETEFLPGKRFRDAGPRTRGRIDISRVSVDDRDVAYGVDTTILAVALDQPLNPGDSLTLRIDFQLEIPKIFSRLGYRGDHYEFVQWYPKFCVFDKHGWRLDTYHAIGEFYGEFGDFDVTIDVPADYIVAATGYRVLDERCGLREDRRIVRFTADNVHDFAWVCDPDYTVERAIVDDIEIELYYSRKHEKKWRNAAQYATMAVRRFNRWFGKYPYGKLSVVQGVSSMSTMEYPMLVLIGAAEDPLTRSFELVIAHEIAHQWFYGVLGFNEMDEAWLDEGLASYAEIRYFEDRYGRNGSIIKSTYLPPLSKRYYNRFIYYLTWRNQLERPVLTPAHMLHREPIAYLNNAYAKPVLFLMNLEDVMGRDIFEKALRVFYERFKFKHPDTGDFINTFEEVSGRQLHSMFDYFLNTTEFCDWDIEEVSGNAVTIRNNGKWLMPTDVLIRTEHGAQTYYVDGTRSRQTFLVPESAGPIRGVSVDPNDNCIDVNRWNNHYPARISIKPYIQFPSFDAYQILILPYPWYGTDDGVTLNLHTFGARFVDYDFLKGQHQFLTGLGYGTRSTNFSMSVNYQTPLVFRRNWRLRIKLKGSRNWWQENAGVGLSHNIGVAFTRRANCEIEHFFDYTRLKSLGAVDSIDWETGRVVTFNNQVKFRSGSYDIRFTISAAHEYLGSDYRYLRGSLAVKREMKILVPVGLRLFGGYIIGDAPLQDNFFLSGALRITTLPDLVFGQKGYFSPQEHIHIPGDGNMRGYQTMHIKSDRLIAMNIECPSRSLLRVFADVGWYGEWAWGAGVRLVLGPISFNVPLYIKDQAWRVHWSIGF